ncbi:urea ABC transporter ATP-binding protein UrtD [Corynebacterium callunae]|uniref:urea ABC transporter ATP-binding protein UrtD n=1 Tax=Corynebacterium callunae TaxID=1721 RepID=UPI003981FDD6
MSLDIKDLSVKFGSFTAVDGISFQVSPGEVHFLIGANGAGKTTCIDAISGLAPGEGSVKLDGKQILGTPVHRIARMGVGRTFQTASVFEELSVLQNLDIACGLHRPLRSLFGIRHKIDPRIEHALEVTKLGALLNSQAGSLSHGQKQWLEIAMLLVQDARVLMLDEPVAGMSEEERVETGQLLTSVSANRIVLVVEHDMEFMRRFATFVTVMNRGTILTEGTVDEIQAHKGVQSIYLGTAAGAGE